jgi:hypothetical protein
MSKDKHWEPQERQKAALVRRENEILYGGARGGGKTDAGMAWMLYDVGNPKFRGLVIRRNADDLKDWIDRAREMYKPMKASFVGQPVEVRFPTGAVIRTGHLKDESAYSKYQGHEYHKILIEELTQIPYESQYEKLLGSNRSTVEGLKPQVFCTTNPDGPGHYWVKERFQCELPTQEPQILIDEQTGIKRSRIFIPAKLEDNKHLMDADPGYVVYLNNITDEVLKRQWREGSWEDPNIEGAYYAKQIRRMQEEGRIRSHLFDSSTPVDTYWDIGVGDATSIWFVQQVATEVRVIDFFEAEGEGFSFYARILQNKAQQENEGYVYRYHYAPHDIKVRELGTGKSRLEVAKRLGINFDIVPRLSIEDGINAVRELFGRCYFDLEKTKEGLTALRNYRKEKDEKRQTFKPKPLHDWSSHASDAFRYVAVSIKHRALKSGYDKEKVHINSSPYGMDGNYL